MSAPGPDAGPRVLVVDDEPELQLAFADELERQGVAADVVDPVGVTEDLLLRADLVACDEVLDWAEGDLPEEAAFRPVDGLALAGVLRSQVDAAGSRAVFVLRTGQLDTVGAGLPEAAREELLAAQVNMDYVLRKQNIVGVPENAVRVAALARAGQRMRVNLAARVHPAGVEWLHVPDAPWRNRALWQVEACRPPEHAVAAYTRGGAFLRWLLHRVLPFPTFLLNDLRAAVRLELPLATFRDVCASGSPLAEDLEGLRYTGELSAFTSRRWWRAGLDDLIDGLLEDPSDQAAQDERSALAEGLSRRHGRRLELLELDQPVVAIDVEYAELEDPVDRAEAVQLSPDLWPVFADQPYAVAEQVVADPALRQIVALADRDRVAELAGDAAGQPG